MLPNPNIAFRRAARVIDQMSRSWPLVTWRARYSGDPLAADNITDEQYYPTYGPTDPHNAAALGVATCPTCYDSTFRRPADAACPTCFGTGWNGGYHPELGARMYITEGDIDIDPDASQELIVSDKTRGLYAARYLILPMDLVLVNDTGILYEVGKVVKQAGMSGMMICREATLRPVNPGAPARAVPITKVYS
jgi:hypothetical protein